MDADETRHLLGRHRDGGRKFKFDRVAFAFVLLTIIGWALVAYRWNRLALAANIFTIVTTPAVMYLFLNGWFGLNFSRVRNFARYVLRRPANE